MKKFAEKLRSDKKTQAAVICGSVGAVIVMAAAITIPVTLHNRISVEKQAAQAAVSTESVTAEITTAAQAATVPETTQIAEATTVAPTTSAANNNSASSGGSDSSSSKSSGSSKSTDSGSSSSSSGSGSGNSGSSSQKPVSNNSGNGSSAGSVQSDAYQWTQADVDTAVAAAKQYAISKGCVIDSSLTEKGTTWMNPLDTRLDAKSSADSSLRYQIDNSLKNTNLSEEQLAAAIAAGLLKINIFSVNCGTYWEIYVVY